MPSTPTTRAVRLHRPDLAGPPRLLVDEIPIPRPDEREVVVAVQAAGVGGFEAALVSGVLGGVAPSSPRVIGREAAGVIADVGSGVEGWQIGDRVAILADHFCGSCGMCGIGRENLCHHRGIAGVEVDGVLSGFVRTRMDRVVPVPLDMSFSLAAIVPSAVAAPYHALKRAGVAEGSVVVIVGVGGLGVHAVQLAALAGADVIAVDVQASALERAAMFGAEPVLATDSQGAAAQVRALVDGGADRVLEFAGRQDAVDTAVRCVARGGRIVIAGTTPGGLAAAEATTVVLDELEIVGAFGASSQDVGELFDLLEEGRLDLARSVTHTTDLDGVAEVVRRYGDGGPEAVRTVVTDVV